MLTNKIDFAIVFSADRANPNGDPLNGNRPRADYEGYGEVSDVCLKRKIRNRLQDFGQSIFVQSDDRADDGFATLKNRAEANAALKAAKTADGFAAAACEQWFDVRAFGQVFAYKKLGDRSDVSVGVRGPVSIQAARSVEPVDVTTIQITKSVSNEPSSKGEGRKSSDTMGQKHRVDYGVYVAKGSMNVQLSEKTGFSDEDAELVRLALVSLFENDVSSARPDGSMAVEKVIWWRHNCPSGQYSSAKVHNTLKVGQTGREITIQLDELPGLTPQIYDGV